MLRGYFLGLLLSISLSTAQVIFDGSWTNDLQSQCGKLTQTAGSSVVLKFSGTYITVRGPPPADPDTIAATLDGAPSSLNPNGTGCMAFLYQTTALPLGSHTLNLTFVGPASNLSITSWACGVDSDIAIFSAAPSGTSTSANPSSTPTSANPSSIIISVNPSSTATNTSSFSSASGKKPFSFSAGAHSPGPSTGAPSGTSRGANPSGTSTAADNSGISTGTNASGGPTAPNTSSAHPSRPTTGTDRSGTSAGANPAAASTGGNHSGASTGADHFGTSTGTSRSSTSTGSSPPGPSTGANDSGTITDAIPSSTAASCANQTDPNSCSTFTGASPSRTSTSRLCDLASISGAYQSCGVKLGITGAAAPSVTSISPIASGTSTGTNHSAASTGGALGGAFGIIALLVAIIYQYLKAPSPSASSDYYFWFVLPSPIKFRGKTLQDAQITVVLQPARLALTEAKPERGFTLSGSRRHELVAWKVFTLSAGEEGQHVRLPRNLGFGDVEEDSGGSLATDCLFNFAPLRTLVTRTTEGSWKSARIIIPGLTAMVVGKNAAPQPVDFALGTYHTKRGMTGAIFHPFGVVRRVLNSQFCVVPQCEELVVNAYITQSIDQRQLLTDVDTNEDPNAAPLPAIEDDDNEDWIPLLETDSSYTNRLIPGSQQDPNAAPRPIMEDDDNDDLSPKILSRGLLGANGVGQPVSSLQQRTRWDLVDDDHGLRLKMVTDARAHRKQWNDRWTYT